MHLPKNVKLMIFPISSNYLPWVIFFIATTLILIILVVVIVICSSFKKKRRLKLNKSLNIENEIFIVNGTNNSFDKIKCDWINKTSEISNDNVQKTKKKEKYVALCCGSSRKDSLKSQKEENSVLTSSNDVIKVNLREKEKCASTDSSKCYNNEAVLDSFQSASDAMSELETTGRTSHIDRELPPIPKPCPVQISDVCFTNSIDEPEMTSMAESENYNELRSTDETENDEQRFVVISDSASFKSATSSTTKLDKFLRISVECVNCRCSGRQDVLSSDDLSSYDYDPTYAAIKCKKRSCPVCGVPSVYTPAYSNRNSNLSLQFNSCLTSPSRTVELKPLARDSLNNSTYANITKLSKTKSKVAANKDQVNSGSSTMKRQRSISQGDIKRSTFTKGHELQKSDVKIENSPCNFPNKSLIKNQSVFNKSSLNTISLWSLMNSNGSSPYRMFPLIPERTYGQSVVDLITKLRESESLENTMGNSCFDINDLGRCFTPPILFNNSFKKYSSLIKTKNRLWTPPSCQMLHGNGYMKSSLYYPLKIFDPNSFVYDLNFPDLNGSCRKGIPSFQPLLTPPLSPTECLNSEKDESYESAKSNLSTEDLEASSKSILKQKSNDSVNKTSFCQDSSVYEDLDFDSTTKTDIGLLKVDNEKNVELQESDLYDSDYLLYSYQKELKDDIKLLEYSDDSITSRSRPISIHLFGNEFSTNPKPLKYRIDKGDLFGFSSVQMSPLMEQSIENSSSKTTLSSLSFHQFNRLISSEDSCAKSPSAEPSPSLDNFEISTETAAFLYNDLMWSKLNSAFDDYDTFE